MAKNPIRLFRENKYEETETLSLKSEEYHHLVNVLRVKINDTIDIIFNDDFMITCKITELSKKNMQFTQLNSAKINQKTNQKRTRITLIQGLPKQDKFSDILRMCTEIGVDHFIPLYTDRSIPKQDTKKEESRLTRWSTICLSAAMQSQRYSLPTIAKPLSFEEWIELPQDFDIKLVPWEEESTRSLKDYMNSNKIVNQNSHLSHIALFIGPEGGLTGKEVLCLENIGFTSVSLGKTILRTQHAGFYTISQLRYALD